MRAVGWGAAVLVLAASSARPAGAEVFRYRYRPGQVNVSRNAMAGASMVGQRGGRMVRMQFRMASRETERVVSASNGVLTLEVTDTPLSGKMFTGGRESPMPGGQKPSKSLIRITDRGRFISRQSLGGAEAEGEGGDLTQDTDALYGLDFPDRDLKPGDTWQDTFRMGAAGQQHTVRVTGRYVGKVTYHGRPCAKFTISLTSFEEGPTEASDEGGPAPQARQSVTVTTLFDVQRGIELYSSGSILTVMRADLSSVGAEGGDFATVSKTNVIQVLVPNGR